MRKDATKIMIDILILKMYTSRDVGWNVREESVCRRGGGRGGGGGEGKEG